MSTEKLMLSNCGTGKTSWGSLGQQGDQTSQSWKKSILDIHWKGWCWNEAPILWPPNEKRWLIGKDPDAGKDWGQEEKMVTEAGMIKWHHRHNGHEVEETPGNSEAQGRLACCSPWGCKESDTTEWMNYNNWKSIHMSFV